MAVTLSASLRAHQRQRVTKPALEVFVRQTRFGVPLFRFEELTATAEPSAPIAVASGGLATVAARNDAGALDISGDFGATWSNLDTITAGQGIALARDTVAQRFGLLYGDGNDLKFRSTSSVNGTTFGAPTTIVTEASAIGSVALAFDDNGDACAFYTLGTTTTLKRLRRTTGTWAGAGTNWSKSASVASLTGLAAVWDSDYYLAVTGTEVTTTHERLWSVAMGDTVLPANAWSAFVPIAEADAAASTTFGFPSLAYIAGVLFCTFLQVEAGDVAASRVMMTSTTETGNPLGFWREPFPPTDATTDHGAALAYSTSLDNVFLAAPSTFYSAGYPGPTEPDVSARVLALSWRETPSSLRLRLELEDHADKLQQEENVEIQLGMDLVIRHGYRSGTAAAAEYGVLLRASISKIAQRFVPGKASIVIEADGPWEAFARYRAPQVWTAPAAYTRRQIFQRFAARAGVEVVDATGDSAPSTEWSTAAPGFAVAAGERAAATLDRLMEATPDFLRTEGSGGQPQMCGGLTDDQEPDPEETYALPARPGNDEHPLITLARLQEMETSWVRLQGEDRYADRFFFEERVGFERDGSPWGAAQLELVRSLDADDDTKANAAASYALLRRQLLSPRAELTAQAHVGQELFDAVNTSMTSHTYSPSPPTLRIISRGLDYKAGTAGPTYQSVFTLGRT